MEQSLVFNPEKLGADLVSGGESIKLLMQGFHNGLEKGQLIFAGNGLLVQSPVDVSGDWNMTGSADAEIIIKVAKNLSCTITHLNKQSLAEADGAAVIATEFQKAASGSGWISRETPFVNIDGMLRNQNAVPVKDLSQVINSLLVDDESGPFRVIDVGEGRECQFVSSHNFWITIWRESSNEPALPPWLGWGTPSPVEEEEETENDDISRGLETIRESDPTEGRQFGDKWDPDVNPEE